MYQETKHCCCCGTAVWDLPCSRSTGEWRSHRLLAVEWRPNYGDFRVLKYHNQYRACRTIMFLLFLDNGSSFVWSLPKQRSATGERKMITSLLTTFVLEKQNDLESRGHFTGKDHRKPFTLAPGISKTKSHNRRPSDISHELLRNLCKD